MDITLPIAEKLGLRAEEFERIKEILGRTPNFTELSAYSVMWSEHCSYKNSIRWLKTLPREGSRLLVKAGEENAGLVDIGEGEAVVFKIESHNHPSAIEPFQGAATGVGGIHRDIFTMGARPIASLNSLRFGDLGEEKTRALMSGVVHGIGHYGNCFGVPTVGGEVYFEPCYHTNPLVNAMSVGLVKVGKTISATAAGRGNPVFIVGSATGKDGMGGAAFASADITESSAEQLPAVQVGDPFQEKKLLEACLEVVAAGGVVGMQDMGAAGIICSTSEMSAKGGVGMRIDLSKVPTRGGHMKAWELLLSESQERMLIVMEKGKEEAVLRIFQAWDLPCSEIGTVTDDGRLRFYLDGELEADLPAESLVLGGGAPQYEREYREPAYFALVRAFDPKSVPAPSSLRSIAEALVGLPGIASKRWIYTQYDSMVGTGNASTNAPSDAAVVLVKDIPGETPGSPAAVRSGQARTRALTMTTDCNSRYVFADPYKGGMIAVAEAARNIVCSGGQPLAVTNCLNFGNPYDPEVYYQFVHALKGMGDACRTFDTPVTGGNVSFYNQSPDGPVYPTPTIGMVGLLDMADRMTLDFKEEGDEIYLLGVSTDDFASSEYLHKVLGVEYSPAPYFNLEAEYELHELVLRLIRGRQVNAAHDVSEGGLAITLLEMGFPRSLGFSVKAEGPAATKSTARSNGRGNAGFRRDAFWFGEGQGRVVVTVPAGSGSASAFAKAIFGGVPVCRLGKVTAGTLRVDAEDWGDIGSWKHRYDTVIDRYMAGEVL